MESKSHFLIHFIPGILLGSVVGLAFGSLLVASQIPRVSTEQKSPAVTTVSQAGEGEIMDQSCDDPANDLYRECLFLRKGDYLPIGTGAVTGRYLGMQTFEDAWEPGNKLSCPVFEIDGGSELIMNGLKKLSASGSGVVPLKDGKFLWTMGTELPWNIDLRTAVKVFVNVPLQPEAGVGTCYSPFIILSSTDMY